MSTHVRYRVTGFGIQLSELQNMWQYRCKWVSVRTAQFGL